ncbi:DUF1641 domain-containing protein [Archaeoglobus fulgidus]|uniref:DUF1641 domain-containing protein n=2 Tax=Archaeoglobus fulgidus TaxID=2234 RepID=A0A075WBN3_ARCFL|nr:DUF1641 domain-containing protein [Archaeoglobus fulgidus]AIG97376.1 hypothetical protein AFULGI_00005680 [Archaeoglobus fulgidus DSM 8774]KUJ92658.1 MAG: hypothetical protein XD40_2147 [Archaeoglobus fulgidus]KUK05877.1 MAG: hypothetical protein XD48_1886 [Archaeoglobus fulgidus]
MSEEETVKQLEPLLKKIAENQEHLIEAIDKLVWLEKSGNLDALLGFSALIKIVQDSISDAVVERNMEMLSNIGLISTKFTSDRALVLLNALGDAICRCEKEPEPVGMVGLMKALREPEVQKALGMLLNIARELGKNI